jgi:hypothetical protein
VFQKTRKLCTVFVLCLTEILGKVLEELELVPAVVMATNNNGSRLLEI